MNYMHINISKAQGKKKRLYVKVVFLISEAVCLQFLGTHYVTLPGSGFVFEQVAMATKGGKFKMTLATTCHKLELWDTIQEIEALKATRLLTK